MITNCIAHAKSVSNQLDQWLWMLLTVLIAKSLTIENSDIAWNITWHKRGSIIDPSWD